MHLNAFYMLRLTGALKSQELTTWDQNKRMCLSTVWAELQSWSGVEHSSVEKKLNMRNDKQIKSCLSRFGLQLLAVSACCQPFCRGAHAECLQTRVDSSSSENEASQAPAATSAAASESATAVAASASDDCWSLERYNITRRWQTQLQVDR